MFVVPAILTLAGGVLVTGYLGAAAFRGFRDKLDTRQEALDFLADLAGTIIGLSAIVTAVHSLVA